MTLAALSENPVHTTLWDLRNEVEMGHIQLSREADLVVVCPATANMLAKMAAGIADDLATTLLLATDKPVMAVPAMNVRMWSHAAVQANVARLREAGVIVLDPDEGPMACGEYGAGRLPEPPAIWNAIASWAGQDTGTETRERESQGGLGGLIASLIPRGGRKAAPQPDTLLAEKGGAAAAAPEEDRGALYHFDGAPLAGRHVLVTAGPTHEPIDPVRYIANRSSGAQGTALARALLSLGAEVVFVTGPADVPPPSGVELVRVETARQMADAVAAALPVDAAVFAAAVADWRVASESGSKIKKDGKGTLPTLKFAENPDILATTAQMKEGRPGLVVGFAAETDDVIANATAKRKRKGCDWIVANDVSPATGIMGGGENAVTIISEEEQESWPRMGKDAVAARLAEKIARALS